MKTMKFLFLFALLVAIVSSEDEKSKSNTEILDFLEQKAKEIFEKANTGLEDASQKNSLEATVSSLDDFNQNLAKVMDEYAKKFQLQTDSNLRKAGSQAELSQLQESLNLQKNLNEKLQDDIKHERNQNEEKDQWKEHWDKAEETWSVTEEIEKKIITGNLDRTLYTEDDVNGAKKKGEAVQGYMSTCLNAFLKNVPPSFCYKKGADFGRIPDDCPASMEKRAALCFDRCRDGYYHFGGVCWQSCGSYKDIGLICTKGIFNWFWKKSYVPRSITFFSSQVVCHAGEYKSGALCYRDCSKAGMVNCGIGACALSGPACAKGIIEIAFDFICGLGELILFIVSFGASSAATESANVAKAAKTSLATAVKKAGQEAMHAAFNTVKSWLANFTKEKLKKFILDKAKEFLVGKVISTVIEKACGAVGDYLFDEVSKAQTPNLKIDEQSSITDKIPIYGKCSKIDTSNNSPNDEIECAKDILNTVGMVDPTGIVSMAAAFLKPVCDV